MSSAAQRPYLRGDAGQVAGIEVLPFGLLLFVVGSLLVANAWAVVDAKFATEAAAREAARAFVEAPDGSTAVAAADTAARASLAGHGRDPHRLALSLDTEGGLSFRRCLRVTARAAYRVPALTLPFVGGFGDGRGVEVVATHSERVDPYRAGLAGEGGC